MTNCVALTALTLTLLLSAAVFLQASSFVMGDSAAPTIEWSKTFTYGTYGGITSMTATADGGYALAGYVVELGAPGQQTSDAWLLKVDASGNKAWEQGLSEDYLNLGQVSSIVQARDGGYVMVCVALVKTDSLGKVEWKQTYPNIALSSIVKTSDNGYALAGSVHDGGFWLGKVNSNGSLQWSQTYGGANQELCGSLVQTVDGGYSLGGSTYSYASGAWDMWLVRTDSAGKMLWNQTYSTQKDDQGNGILQTNDSFMLAEPAGNTLRLVKFDSSGKMVWNQTYNQIGNALVRSLIETTDGGYAVVVDSGLIKIDASGNLQWRLPYDGTYAAIQKGNGYVLAGSSPGTSPGGGWIAKISAPAILATSTPTALPTKTATPPPTSSFPISDYLLIIALIVAIVAIVIILTIKTKKRLKK